NESSYDQDKVGIKNDHSSDEFISADDVDSGEDDNTGEDENTGQRDNAQDGTKVGPGRPKLIRTGKPGRPRKQYNVLGTAINSDVYIPVS
ncbi:hypothetical protein KR059_009902, partial [Drosophila kikkawai]